MFAYPIGPQRNVCTLSFPQFLLLGLSRYLQLLFLDRDAVEGMDPRDDRTSAIRSKLLELLAERMRQQQPQLVQLRPSLTNRTSSEQPSTPPITAGSEPNVQNSSILPDGPQLPPLSFAGVHNQDRDRMLTPIAEGGSTMTHGRGMSVDGTMNVNAPELVAPSGQTTAPDKPDSPTPLLDRGYSSSPDPAPTPPPMSITSGTGVSLNSSVVEPRSFVQPARLLSSVDRKTSSPITDQSSTVPQRVTPVPHSPRPSTSTKIDKPLVVVNKEEAEASNGDQLNVSPLEPLVSPYSPIDRPATSVVLTESDSAGPKSPSTSVLTSPYSQGDHYITGDTASVSTLPHSINDRRTRASGEFQGLGKASMDLHASSTRGGRRPSNSGQTLSPSSPVARKSPARGSHEPDDTEFNEVRALYLMHQSRLESGDDAGPVVMPNRPRIIPMPPATDGEDEDEDDEEEEEGEGEEDQESETEISQRPGKGVCFFPNVLDETVKNLNAQPHHLPTRTDHRQFDRELQWHSWREMKLEYLWLLHCL